MWASLEPTEQHSQYELWLVDAMIFPEGSDEYRRIVGGGGHGDFRRVWRQSTQNLGRSLVLERASLLIGRNWRFLCLVHGVHGRANLLAKILNYTSELQATKSR